MNVHRNVAGSLFVVTSALACVAVVVAALVLPERVPTHFGGTGMPDDWSSRAGAVTFLAVHTAGMVALFAALVRWVPRMPAEWINVPHKQQWLRSGLEGELRRRLRIDLLVFGVGMNVVSLSVTLSLVQAAHTGDGRMPVWWFVVLGAWLLFTIGQVVVMHAVRYRLEPVPDSPVR